MTLTPARALIGALTPEEAKQIAAPGSWHWPISEDARQWVRKVAEADGAFQIQQEQAEFNRAEHERFMRSL